jgi:hypothetical protein
MAVALFNFFFSNAFYLVVFGIVALTNTGLGRNSARFPLAAADWVCVASQDRLRTMMGSI